MLKKVSIVPAVALLAALFIVLPASHSGHKVEMSNFRFAPMDFRVGTGGAITFENSSTTTHTATCVQCPVQVDSGDVQPGLSKTVTFRKDGTYIFVCRYHQARNMVMRVKVGAAEQSPSPSPT